MKKPLLLFVCLFWATISILGQVSDEGAIPTLIFEKKRIDSIDVLKTPKVVNIKKELSGNITKGDIELTDLLVTQTNDPYGRITLEEFKLWCAANDSSKIVGGSEVTIEEYPWQVFLIVGEYMCGGSIIDENWILTAAHCTDGLTPGEITVYAGSTNIQCL